MPVKKIWYLVFIPILAMSSFSLPAKQRVNIVFIGDSITQGEEGVTPSPDFAMALLKRQLGIDHVKFSNQGVSGCTTVDFLPSTATHFRDVVKAANNFYEEKQATLIFSIMLGTNDSAIDGPLGSPVSPGSYGNNLKIINDRLLKDY